MNPNEKPDQDPVGEALRRLPRETASPGFTKRVMDSLPQQKAHMGFSHPVARLAWMTMAVVALSLSLLWMTRSPTQKGVPQRGDNVAVSGAPAAQDWAGIEARFNAIKLELAGLRESEPLSIEAVPVLTEDGGAVFVDVETFQSVRRGYAQKDSITL